MDTKLYPFLCLAVPFQCWAYVINLTVLWPFAHGKAKFGKEKMMCGQNLLKI